MQELDEVTLTRARWGERPAQELLLHRYVGPVHAFVRRALGASGGEPDDLVQEILHKVLLALPRFDPAGPAKLSTWIFTLAHNAVLDQRKRRQLSLAALDEGVEVADARRSPEQLFEQQQLGEALESAIATLPFGQRRVFVLAQVHEQPLQDVAASEGVPVGTIKSRLHRARAHLAGQLAGWFEAKGGRDDSAGTA